ncbi:DUF4373 domain-containing protein [Anaerofustis stercorihominis]|uniref:DUF4373 domain-containing protein n=1 Tax=Anaerofustis stercorihominis TaxID=214853 RepID=A0A3E3DXN5_9FIRM|nr:DUF4373 domain-containing protein [Anaerofustis stercorihominis]RGD73846.1 DUF4373 domain-containing protein [Anaerofustis stercorihominis]
MEKGINYFPLEVHLNDKVGLIEAEFGLNGFAVVVKLYQKIYGSLGYYCEWNEEVALLFSKSINMGGNVVSEIIKQCLNRDIFDKTLFDKYGILTSKGIQERYFEIVKRRKNVEVVHEYLLVKIDQKYKIVYKNKENVYKNEKDVNISKQSKVKESKVKESKRKYGEYKHVLLTDKEIKSLKSKLGEDMLKTCVIFLDEYIEMKGYKAKSHNLAIQKWVVDAVKEEMIRKEKISKHYGVNNKKETIQSDIDYEYYNEEDIEKMMSEN